MKKRNDRQKSDTNTVQETTLAQDLVQLLLKIVLLLLVVFLIFYFFFYGIVRINDISMKPSIKDGDLVLYYRLDHRFISGDVAVFEKDDKTTTGRVVAVAGDTVDITKDGLKINGAEQISQDIYFDTTRFKKRSRFPTYGERRSGLCTWRQQTKGQ